jgi:hypothetical protein
MQERACTKNTARIRRHPEVVQVLEIHVRDPPPLVKK